MSLQENIEERYKLLIYNYLSGKTTEEEKNTLLKWLQQSDENKKLYTDYHNIFDLTINAEHLEKISTRNINSWKHFSAKIDTAEKENNQKSPKKLTYYFRIAASIILIFSLGVLSSLWLTGGFSNHKLSEIEHEITVPKGGKSELVLPDGTKVWLNAGTRFRYKGDYGFGNRDVYLEGEGYFSVIKNPKKPFVVQTAGYKIKAFGTSFNVKAYPEEKTVITTLVEGVVKIEGKGVNVSLKPKQVVMLRKQLVAAKGETNLSENKSTSQHKILEEGDASLNRTVQLETNVNTNIYTSWKDNSWIINSESLKDIAVVLERKFNVNIQIESSLVNQYKFTGTFNKETLEQILNVIKLTAPIKYEINKGVVVIREEIKRKATYKEFM